MTSSARLPEAGIQSLPKSDAEVGGLEHQVVWGRLEADSMEFIFSQLQSCYRIQGRSPNYGEISKKSSLLQLQQARYPPQSKNRGDDGALPIGGMLQAQTKAPLSSRSNDRHVLK